MFFKITKNLDLRAIPSMSLTGFEVLLTGFQMLLTEFQIVLTTGTNNRNPSKLLKHKDWRYCQKLQIGISADRI